jgi:outer membrane scaffolding protein for murein synthesis (MipA/OmpV family)
MNRARRKGEWCWAVWLLATILSLVGTPAAWAQTPSPLQEWQYPGGIVLEKMFQPNVPTWRFILGAGTAVKPIYDGAQTYRVQAGPVINIRYKDVAFASVGEGLGVDLLRGENSRAGIALAYDLGRRVAQYPSHLQGLGNIEPAPVAKMFASYAVSK